MLITTGPYYELAVKVTITADLSSTGSDGVLGMTISVVVYQLTTYNKL